MSQLIHYFERLKDKESFCSIGFDRDRLSKKYWFTNSHSSLKIDDRIADFDRMI